jgi:hypothetical protein
MEEPPDGATAHPFFSPSFSSDRSSRLTSLRAARGVFSISVFWMVLWFSMVLVRFFVDEGEMWVYLR